MKSNEVKTWVRAEVKIWVKAGVKTGKTLDGTQAKREELISWQTLKILLDLRRQIYCIQRKCFKSGVPKLFARRATCGEMNISGGHGLPIVFNVQLSAWSLRSCSTDGVKNAL